MSLPLLPPPPLPRVPGSNFRQNGQKNTGAGRRRTADGGQRAGEGGTARDAGRDAEKRTSMLVNYAAAPAAGRPAGRRFYERREVG